MIQAGYFEHDHPSPLRVIDPFNTGLRFVENENIFRWDNLEIEILESGSLSITYNSGSKEEFKVELDQLHHRGYIITNQDGTLVVRVRERTNNDNHEEAA